MAQQAQQGYLVLADISGYTSYLAGVELDHAQGILTDLLEVIVSRLRALLTIGKLEGDAVFAYVPASQVGRGETLLELVEATYAAFRDRVEAVRRRTTCTCAACRAIPTLDLKFITHHGDYIVQNIAAGKNSVSELVGSDVNLVHRLLKNHIAERTGWKAYALFTAPVLDHLVVPCDPRELHTHTETYEHLGDILTYSLDLRARYQAMSAARRIVIEAADADMIIEQDFAAPPAMVWDFMNDPTRRGQWMEGTRWSSEARPDGRTGPGARNHCAHGKNETTTETVLDWKPFDYVTVQQAPNEAMSILMTQRLVPSADGRTTHLQLTIKGQFGKLPRFISRPAVRLMMNSLHFPAAVERLRQLVDQQAAGAAPQSGLSLAGAAA
jgi:uncharacterized protein YndB with AHSA1/START domain